MTDAYSIDTPVSKQVKKTANVKLTTEQFIINANKVHGVGRYDYSQAVYQGNKVKVQIKCNECDNVFHMRPNNHIAGSAGCRVCRYVNATVTQAEFIHRSNNAHGTGLYGYDKAIYVKGCLSVSIFCKQCDMYFDQKARDHMNGIGCAQCYFADKRLTQDEFLDRCYKQHGKGAFDYTNVCYYDSHTPVNIGCNVCGYEFEQTPTRHLSTLICCPKCVDDRKGFNRSAFRERCSGNNNGVGKLYVIKACDNGTVFYKVGITSHSRLAVRFKGRGSMPYIYHIAYEIEGSADYIYDLETQFNRLLRGNHYQPSIVFNGSYTECFTTIKPIEQLLKKLSSTEQLQLIA